MAPDHPAGCMDSPVPVSCINLMVLTFFLLAALPYLMNAQQPTNNIIAALDELVDETYGPDQHLINGIEYFNLHIHSSGHKFLDEDKFYKGRVTIDNKVYNEVLLKYDIFNQQLLLLIQHPLGGNKQIILNNLRVDEFEINGRIFHKYTFSGNGLQFYQVIGNDEMACLYHFSKNEIPRTLDRYTLSEFTDVKKKSYIYWQSALHEFKGTRSFLRIFPDHQPQIKSFIRQNKLRVRKLSDPQMHRLIGYCNSITKYHREDP
jgi:hypothetical protein